MHPQLADFMKVPWGKRCGKPVVFCRKRIYKWWVFHIYVSLQDGMFFVFPLRHTHSMHPRGTPKLHESCRGQNWVLPSPFMFNTTIVFSKKTTYFIITSLLPPWFLSVKIDMLNHCFFWKHHGFHWSPPCFLFFSLKIAQKSHGFMVYHPIFPGFQWTFLTSRGATRFPTRRPKIEEARAPKDLPFDGWSMGIKRCAMGTWCMCM